MSACDDDSVTKNEHTSTTFNEAWYFAPNTAEYSKATKEQILAVGDEQPKVNLQLHRVSLKHTLHVLNMKGEKNDGWKLLMCSHGGKAGP